jgi:hypothetical protein
VSQQVHLEKRVPEGFFGCPHRIPFWLSKGSPMGTAEDTFKVLDSTFFSKSADKVNALANGDRGTDEPFDVKR